MALNTKISLNESLPSFSGLVVGLDEAGRGPIAGPVIAAAVILEFPIDGLNDSKKISEKKREELEVVIKERALTWSVAAATVEEIDEINILQASLLAMKRALNQLQIQPQCVCIDGNQFIDCSLPMYAVVKGDARLASISAASILAKTHRDRLMVKLHDSYPMYGFNQHKGYPTASHLQALREFGVSIHHRRSFRPVSEQL